MIKNRISEEKIKQAKCLIDNASKIVIVSHNSPDGDAIGSSLGMYHFLQAMGKEATVVVPNRYPDFLGWMPAARQILFYKDHTKQAETALTEADLLFALDLNALNRLGEMTKAVEPLTIPKILIDHHPYPDSFPEVVISHPEISSTSELVFRFIYQMNCLELLEKQAATCIYTGMMTDTGNFSFNSNQPEIYLIVAQLLRYGINKDDIYNRVFNAHTADRMKLMGYVLCQKMRIYPEYRAALITLTREEMKQYNSKKGDTEGFVNIPLSIKGIAVAAFFREENDRIKVSLRSQGNFPVNKLCAEHYRGGGHFNAAGGESFVSMQELEDGFEAVLKEYFEEKQ